MASTLPPAPTQRRRPKPAPGWGAGPRSRPQGNSYRLTPQARRRLRYWRWLLEQRSTRLMMVWLVLVVALGGLSLKLFQLQIVQGETLVNRAIGQQTLSTTTFIPRRPVKTRDSSILAVDKSVFTLYAHPKLFTQELEDVATQLGEALNMPKAELLKKLSEGETGIKLSDSVQDSTARQIRALYVDGLDLIARPQRFYPQGDLFGSIIGYVNGDQQGQAGVEMSQQDQLERPSLDLNVRRMGDGSVMPADLPDAFLHQDDLSLQLTLDRRLQRATRVALDSQLKKWGAKRGAAMIMDAKDGSMLSLVVAPTYDPNQYWNADVGLFRNWAATDLYEPGSTFKPINVAIALESGKLSPNDYIYDEGQLVISEHVVQNHDFSAAGGRGSLSLPQVMQYSSNISMVHIVEKLTPGNYHSWLEKLGLGKTLATDLPSPPMSELKSLEKFETSPIEPATAAFGQGLSITPLQLAQLHGALANGGKLVSPHVVDGLVDSKGNFHWRPDLPEPRQIFSKQTTQAVLEMMESVVTESNVSVVPGYRIGGKTGTAQKAENGVYVAGARITSFVGILPVQDPRYVVIAVVDEPQGSDAYGSTVAAPVVQEIIKSLVSTLGLPPTEPVALDDQGQPIALDAQGNPITATVETGPAVQGIWAH